MQEVDKQNEIKGKRATLSEKDELLLMRHLDGETYLWERWRAQSLLRQSAAAREFVKGMSAVGALINSKEVPDPSGLEFWARVSNRIAQEERAEIFLGKRATPAVERRPWFQLPQVAWGLSGSVALASLAYVALVATPASLKTESQMAQSVSQENVQLVKAGRPEVLEERSPNVVQVDWMRSDGRVSILQEPSERSAIIWVKKRAAGQGVRAQREADLAAQPTPRITSAAPSFER
jgi:negative regulator of sigma E activity